LLPALVFSHPYTGAPLQRPLIIQYLGRFEKSREMWRPPVTKGEEMNKIKTIPTSDLYFSAFASMRGLPPKLQKNHNHVLFVFPLTDEFNAVSQEFHEAKVDLGAYVAELRKLKAMMFSARDSEEGAACG
jgi:hypothetical protein